MAGLKRYSQLTSKDVYSCTEKSAFSRTDFRELAFANRLARHNIEQILSGSFTAPKLQMVALLSGILFCLFNIIERYERYEDNRSAEFKHSWP